jgi:hypothetical protein
MFERYAAVTFFIVAATLTGCGRPAPSEPAPTTYKVVGKVLKGSKPFTAGGAIEFIADGKRALGDIQPDGAFVLRTVTAQHNVTGAPDASYTVTIVPASQAQNVRPITLKKKYVVAPGDNQLTIQLDE